MPTSTQQTIKVGERRLAQHSVQGVTTNAAEAGKPLTVSGYLQHYDKKNKNGETDQRGCFAAWLEDFNAGRVSLPLVLEHNQREAEHVIGKFVSVEDREDGLYGVAEVVSTPYIDAELAPRIRAGVWPSFSTALWCEEWQPENSNDPCGDYIVTRGYLAHVSLVSTPADTNANATIENKTGDTKPATTDIKKTTNTLTPKTMNKKNKKQVVDMLRNMLASDVSEAVRATVEAAIAELENSEEEQSMQQAIVAIKAKLDGLASNEQVVDIENALKALQEASKPKASNSTADYLNSRQAKLDFVQAMKNNRGNGKAALNEFRRRAAENGVVDTDSIFAPAPVLVQLTDAMRDSWLWKMLNHTGLKTITVGWNTEDGDNPRNQLGRAGGHIPGDEKQVEELDFIGRTLRQGSVYKLIDLPWETLEDVDDDEVLLDYISKELVRALMYELERCVLVHDGRSENDRRKVRSFIPVKMDPWTLQRTYDPANALDGVMEGIVSLRSGGRKVLVATAQTLLKLRRRVYAAGGTPTFASNEQLASELGLEAVLECPNYDTLGEGTILIFDASQYMTVGKRYDTVYSYEIRTNTHVYEIRQMAGGGMGTKGMAVCLTPAATNANTNNLRSVAAELEATQVEADSTKAASTKTASTKAASTKATE